MTKTTLSLRLPARCRSIAALWLPVLWSLLAIGCVVEFDPPTLVQDVRVLGIQSELPDLISGESSVLTSLVGNPLERTLSYHWEWCAVNAGADEQYECLNDELGLPPELLDMFDLGTEPFAVFEYPSTEGTSLQELCFFIRDSVEVLPPFVELPDCDSGIDVLVRLTVIAGDSETEEIERVAIKRVYLWFIDDPPDDQRNDNPVIEGIRANGVPLDEDDVLLVPPSGRVDWFVEVDESSMQWFRPKSSDDPDESQQREEILFSWFGTMGDWSRMRSYADEENFTLAEAGQNTQKIPSDATIGSIVDVYFAIRDGRGGIDWTTRQLEIADSAQ